MTSFRGPFVRDGRFEIVGAEREEAAGTYVAVGGVCLEPDLAAMVSGGCWGSKAGRVRVREPQFIVVGRDV